MFCGSKVRKVGSLKRRVRSYISGQIRDQKLHAAVALSRFGSKNGQNTSAKLRCRKSACWREAHSKVKRSKHLMAGACWSTFGSRAVQKVHGVVAQSTARSQNSKSTPCSELLLQMKTCSHPDLALQSVFQEPMMSIKHDTAIA